MIIQMMSINLKKMLIWAKIAMLLTNRGYDVVGILRRGEKLLVLNCRCLDCLALKVLLFYNFAIFPYCTDNFVPENFTPILHFKIKGKFGECNISGYRSIV